MADWFNTSGKLEPEPLTKKQRWALCRSGEALLDILTPEMRVNAEIMGFEEWIDSLDKSEASYYIRILKGEGVAAEVRRRSADGVKRKWWSTGLSG